MPNVYSIYLSILPEPPCGYYWQVRVFKSIERETSKHESEAVPKNYGLADVWTCLNESLSRYDGGEMATIHNFVKKGQSGEVSSVLQSLPAKFSLHTGNTAVE
ncbi:hypothetical protein DPMN_049659 [Dreissena polymorpha]|uniref:Uncharacterized protein n=1 Tax=Dreissena polymorpha TaxID=45954 RepID=A0A9D4HLI1_DREPO|nr:hypothetical protein DPMN_049659 [Dreissena polymorpha]